MAVARRKKRKILVNGRVFFWYIKGDAYSPFVVLHILSPDKTFIINYTLRQSKSHALSWTNEWLPPFVVVLGGEFGGLKMSGCYRRVRLPEWEEDIVATPSFVRRLIEWCLDENREIILTDWRGQALSKKQTADI